MISGGIGSLNFQSSDLVENTLDGEEIKESVPRLPEEVFGHCLVALEGGDLFQTGGMHLDLASWPWQFTVADKTHIFSARTGEWKRGPDMPTSRFDLMCGLVTTQTGSQEVVAAGGRTPRLFSSDLDVVEIYSIHKTRWRTGTQNFPNVQIIFNMCIYYFFSQSFT